MGRGSVQLDALSLGSPPRRELTVTTLAPPRTRSTLSPGSSSPPACPLLLLTFLSFLVTFSSPPLPSFSFFHAQRANLGDAAGEAAGLAWYLILLIVLGSCLPLIFIIYCCCQCCRSNTTVVNNTTTQQVASTTAVSEPLLRSQQQDSSNSTTEMMKMMLLMQSMQMGNKGGGGGGMAPMGGFPPQMTQPMQHNPRAGWGTATGSNAGWTQPQATTNWGVPSVPGGAGAWTAPPGMMTGGGIPAQPQPQQQAFVSAVPAAPGPEKVVVMATTMTSSSSSSSHAGEPDNNPA